MVNKATTVYVTSSFGEAVKIKENVVVSYLVFCGFLLFPSRKARKGLCNRHQRGDWGTRKKKGTEYLCRT